MFIDFIDHLRCPQPHQETWLVASSVRTVERDLVDGLLGCPICRAEYPIRDGIAYFVERTPEQVPLASPQSQEEAMRLAAFLDLAEPRGYAALAGDWGSHARVVAALTDVHLVLVNPPRDVEMGLGVSGVVVSDALPFSRMALRGIAFDAESTAALMASALPAIRPKGRVVGPVSLPVPEGVKELVRDDRVWVGEREAPPARTIGLARR